MRTRVVPIVVLALLASASQGQNLLQNPDFDTNTAGWALDPPPANQAFWGWVSGGYPAPGGALHFINQAAAAGTSTSVSQCVKVGPGGVFKIAAYYKAAPGQAEGRIGYLARQHSDQNCTNPNGGEQGLLPWPTANGNWLAAEPQVFGLLGNTHSVRVSLKAWKPAAAGIYSASVDNVFAGHPVKGDFDSDGEPDLLLKQVDAPGHHEAWLMSGSARRAVAAITPDATSADGQLVGAGDFGWGFQDLVFWQPSTGQVSFWGMKGLVRNTGPHDLLGAAPLPTSWRVAATADFDHDNKTDILWRDTSSQQLMIWKMNHRTKAGTLTPSPSAAADANWTVVAAQDSNGDGNTDLLWYNATTGKIVQWLMDANVHRTQGRFTDPPSAGNNNWKVAAAGDFGVGANGSAGTNDIVWRNATTGKLVLWYMDQAGKRTAGAFTSPEAPADPLNWTVVGPR